MSMILGSSAYLLFFIAVGGVHIAAYFNYLPTRRVFFSNSTYKNTVIEFAVYSTARFLPLLTWKSLGRTAPIRS